MGMGLDGSRATCWPIPASTYGHDENSNSGRLDNCTKDRKAGRKARKPKTKHNQWEASQIKTNKTRQDKTRQDLTKWDMTPQGKSTQGNQTQREKKQASTRHDTKKPNTARYDTARRDATRCGTTLCDEKREQGKTAQSKFSTQRQFPRQASNKTKQEKQAKQDNIEKRQDAASLSRDVEVAGILGTACKHAGWTNWTLSETVAATSEKPTANRPDDWARRTFGPDPWKAGKPLHCAGARGVSRAHHKLSEK
jgi:hypothetical protein